MSEKPRQTNDVIKSLVLLAALLAVIALVAYMQLPPRPLPTTAPPQAFSAERAFAHIDATCQVSHPDGTPENRAVRDYILKTLQDMGVAAEIHRCVRDWGHHATYGGVGLVENVLARIPGTGGEKAFAMMAHFDSVPYGPGAADDFSGVATMLETARALKAGPPLQNDVIFVFTNGEEGGTHGARAFAEHPWATDIGVILNMEARGTRGPSYMFETSLENGWLIEELAASGVPARATSMMFDVYKRLPFSSDFSRLKDQIPGFNIAFVDNFPYYHTPNDSPERLNLASLQHHGEYAIGLARHFGNRPLTDTRAPEAAYFDVLGLTVVNYPLSWNPILTALAVGTWLAALVTGFVWKRLSVRGLLLGSIAFGLATLAACLVSGVMLGIAWLLRGGYPRILYDQNLYGAAFALAALAVFVLIEAKVFRSLSWEDRFLGGLSWWVLFCVFLQLRFPAGAYFAQWSLFFAAAGCAIAFLVVPKDEKGLTLAAALAFAFGLPALILAVPALFGFFSTLTILFTPILVLMMALFLALLLPLWDSVFKELRGGFVLIASALALVLFATALAIGGPSPDRPEWTCLSYGLNLDASTAYWLSSDLRPHAWNSSCFPTPLVRQAVQEFMPWDKMEYLKAPAPLAGLPGPDVQLLHDEESDGARVVTLLVSSPREAHAATLYTETAILSANILGIDVKGSEPGWWRTIHILPPEGAEVVLRLPSGAPLRLKVIERFYGLPEVEGLPVRPAGFIGEPNTTFDHDRQLRSNHIFVARTFDFPPTTATASAPQ